MTSQEMGSYCFKLSFQHLLYTVRSGCFIHVRSCFTCIYEWMYTWVCCFNWLGGEVCYVQSILGFIQVVSLALPGVYSTLFSHCRDEILPNLLIVVRWLKAFPSETSNFFLVGSQVKTSSCLPTLFPVVVTLTHLSDHPTHLSDHLPHLSVWIVSPLSCPMEHTR